LLTVLYYPGQCRLCGRAVVIPNSTSINTISFVCSICFSTQAYRCEAMKREPMPDRSKRQPGRAAPLHEDEAKRITA
jgi:hypothetical protein